MSTEELCKRIRKLFTIIVWLELQKPSMCSTETILLSMHDSQRELVYYSGGDIVGMMKTVGPNREST